MVIADFFLKLIIFVLQKMVLPLFPVDLPNLSLNEFAGFLQGTLKHNLTWALAGMSSFFNIKLIFILLLSIITAEVLYWSVKAGIFLIKLIRGAG